MRAKLLVKISGIFMLLAFSFVMIPFAAFHHHETVCDISSDIPVKFRKEKDQSKHHFHESEGKCFVCSHAIVKDYIPVQNDVQTVSRVYSICYVHQNYLYTFVASIELNNKAPPVSA